MSSWNAVNFQSISDKVHFQSELQLHNKLDTPLSVERKLEIAVMQGFLFQSSINLLLTANTFDCSLSLSKCFQVILFHPFKYSRILTERQTGRTLGRGGKT